MEGCKNQSKKREQHFLLVCLFGEKIEPSLIATKQLPFFNKHGRDCHFWLTTITILTVLGKRETTRNHVGNNAEKTVPMRRIFFGAKEVVAVVAYFSFVTWLVRRYCSLHFIPPNKRLSNELSSRESRNNGIGRDPVKGGTGTKLYSMGPKKGMWSNETHFATGYDLISKADFKTAKLDRADDLFLVIRGEIVMAHDEERYMKALAKVITTGNAKSEGDILEIGFGMGISSGFIQDFGCKRHVIVEANAEVLRLGLAWRESQRARSSVEFLEGYSEDVLPRLPSSSFDGIFADPFPTTNNIQSHTEYRRLLRPGGKLAFFLETLAPDDSEKNSILLLDIVELLHKAGWEDDEIGLENWEMIPLTITDDCRSLTFEDAELGFHDRVCPDLDSGFYVTNLTRKNEIDHEEI
jgi:SAM-dependent methyltransferase